MMTYSENKKRWMMVDPYVPLEMNDVLADMCPFLYAKLWKRHVAAAIVQRMVRGHLARKMVNDMRSESMSKSTTDPMWDDESVDEMVYEDRWNGLPIYPREEDRYADDWFGRG